MQDFRKLGVWQVGRGLTKSVYEASRYPKSELFGLTAQTRRSAISICSNIAEGCGRENRELTAESYSRKSVR